jgi:hypothetical protein
LISDSSAYKLGIFAFASASSSMYCLPPAEGLIVSYPEVIGKYSSVLDLRGTAVFKSVEVLIITVFTFEIVGILN